MKLFSMYDDYLMTTLQCHGHIFQFCGISDLESRLEVI